MTGLPKWSTLVDQINNAVNISTVSKTNIMIDKLTQGAYTENRVTISNNGATQEMFNPADAYDVCKFFPRGCRGYIKSIELYCKDDTGTGGEIKIYLSPTIGSGYLYTVDFEYYGSTVGEWRTAAFDIFWNYDSLFIRIDHGGADIDLARDDETPHDTYITDDKGLTFTVWDYRAWFRVVYKGQTVGDLPVSGTVNTVNIPNVLTGYAAGLSTEVDGGSSVVLLNWVYGMGSLDALMCNVHKTTGGTVATDMEIRIRIDGVDHKFNVGTLALLVKNEPLSYSPISFTHIDTTNIAYGLVFNFKMIYRNHLKIDLYNVGGIGDKMKTYFMYAYSTLR